MAENIQNKPKEQANFIGVGITLLVIVILAFFIDLDSVQTWVLGAGVWGPLVFILLKVSTIVIAPLSGSPLYPLVGLLFGFWPGFLYVVIGDFIGYTIAFYISRIFGQRIVSKFISTNEEGILARIVSHMGTTKGFLQACVICFGLPEVLSYGAGLSKLPYIKFISILWPIFTAITAVLVFFGSTLDHDKGSALIGFALPVAGALAIIIGGGIFMRSMKKKVIE
jgi:uncharacterized membrane protein YdjX (TVP38/TMEM64 family)